MAMDEPVEGLEALYALEKAVGDAACAAMQEMALVGQREAIRNAPRSPTTTQSRNASKKRRGGANSVAKKKAGAKSSKSGKPSKAGAKAKPTGKGIGRKSSGLKARPSRRAKSRQAPGGLERSIKSEFRKSANWEDSEIDLYVESGSEATKYAKRIEEERYKTWRKRGIGTVRKGARAKEFFIRRAAESLPVDQVVGDAIMAAVEKSQDSI